MVALTRIRRCSECQEDDEAETERSELGKHLDYELAEIFPHNGGVGVGGVSGNSFTIRGCCVEQV